MSDRSWIVDPIGHRQAERESFRAWAETHPDEAEVTVFSGAFMQDTDWVCDWCNGDIDIKEIPMTGLRGWVAVLGRDALCQRCVKDWLEKNDPKSLRRVIESWVAWWSRDVCSCKGCIEGLHKWVEVSPRLMTELYG